MKLNQLIEAAEKKFVIIDVNVDYEDDNGRDRNKTFAVAIDCGVESAAVEFAEKFKADSEIKEVRFSDDSDVDADDIVNGSTFSHTITMGKGVVAKPPKNAYLIPLGSFKYDAE